MTKLIGFWFISAILLTAFVSCGGGNGGDGANGRIDATFIRDGHPDDYLKLRPDGNFLNEEDGQTIAGTYDIYDEELVLTASFGATSVGTFDGAVIIDNEGKRWVKGERTYGILAGQRANISAADRQGWEIVQNLLAEDEDGSRHFIAVTVSGANSAVTSIVYAHDDIEAAAERYEEQVRARGSSNEITPPPWDGEQSSMYTRASEPRVAYWFLAQKGYLVSWVQYLGVDTRDTIDEFVERLSANFEN